MARQLRPWARLWLLACLLFPACGFHPLYGRTDTGQIGPAQQGLAAINIGLIPERQGQLLRLDLQERFQRANIAPAKRYDLIVALTLESEGLAIEQDNTSTRQRVTGNATWTLTAQDPQRTTLASGNAHALDGYNIINSQYFASDQDNDQVQRRMMERLADQIALQIGTYFDKAARLANNQ